MKIPLCLQPTGISRYRLANGMTEFPKLPEFSWGWFQIETFSLIPLIPKIPSFRSFPGVTLPKFALATFHTV